MGGYTKKFQNLNFFNGFWEDQGVQDGGKLRLFGGMLATSWGVLGATLGYLGVKFEVLGACWFHDGGLRVILGPRRSESEAGLFQDPQAWHQTGPWTPQLGDKMAPHTTVVPSSRL